ncbi:unnamed protein product [Closterium sp. NIES-53]
MTTLRLLLHVAAHRDYELHSLDFSTAFLQGSLHEEIWLRRPPGFTGSFPPGTQWSLRRPVYGLRQAPRKEGCRIRFLLAEFKLLGAEKPTILRIDNKSAITVAAGLGLTGNLKHMERRYAWLQHMVRHGKFVLKYIPTTEQSADFLTKALHFPAFNWCSAAIGQVRLADVGDGDDDVQ